MPDPNVRSDSVNVERIMEQIRARIREKRGVDYSEQQVRELAATKLDKLLDQFRRTKPPEPPPNYTFEDDTLFESPSGLVRVIRRLLRPILGLFINPGVLADALHIQAQLNARQAQLEATRHMLYDELIHNLVIEAARLGLEIKSMKMHVESLASRLDFSERRVRTLESTTIYRPSADERHGPQVAVMASAPAPPSAPSFSTPAFSPPQPSSPVPSVPASTSTLMPATPSSAQPVMAGPRPMGPGLSGTPDGQRRRRRRRRRGRRGSGPGSVNVESPGAAGPAGAGPAAAQPSQAASDSPEAGYEAEIDESPDDTVTDDAGPDPPTTSGPGEPGDNGR
ncbi:MAG: hypothetical protein WBD07_09085 [Vicinamibacterales bacterium]